MTSLHVTTLLNCHWLLALLETSNICMYTACQFMAIVMWVCMTVLLTDTHNWSICLIFQLWRHEEMRAESPFLPSHTMMPSNTSVHEESYKYCIVWYLLEILHNADFTTQIFLHFCTSMIIEVCAVLRCYTACSCDFWPTFRDKLCNISEQRISL
jgi:hypothetical protein